jgi:nucleotide-binding universal stress UspA family protein
MSIPMSPSFTYRRILFCTDFSENADFAFDFAVDAAARRPGCTLYLLHVIPETEAQFWKTYIYEVDHVDEQARAAIDEKIAHTYQPRVPPGLDFQIEMRVGQDSQKILEFAQEKDVDLIVIGRQGRSQFKKALFGNVTEKIVRKAHCVVLVIPLSFEDKVKQALNRGGQD